MKRLGNLEAAFSEGRTILVVVLNGGAARLVAADEALKGLRSMAVAYDLATPYQRFRRMAGHCEKFTATEAITICGGVRFRVLRDWRQRGWIAASRPPGQSRSGRGYAIPFGAAFVVGVLAALQRPRIKADIVGQVAATLGPLVAESAKREALA